MTPPTKSRRIIEDSKASLPKELTITVTGDTSNDTRVTLHDLINTIIIGFLLVTLILMFFMGTTNALFVGLSVPISMFLAFLVIPVFGFTLNMIVLFAFLLALGIVVDDAIVVIENTHRLLHEHPNLTTPKAAKFAAGEVFVPGAGRHAHHGSAVRAAAVLAGHRGLVHVLPARYAHYHADGVADRGLHHEPGVCRELHAARRAFRGRHAQQAQADAQVS